MSKKRKKFPKRRRQRLLNVASDNAHSINTHSNNAASAERIDVSISELEAIIERSKTELLSEQDCKQLRSVLQTLYFLTQELEKKGASIQRLRKLLFGASTEKLQNIINKTLGPDDNLRDKQQQDPQPDKSSQDKTKPKGHGRNGADKYTGAEKVRIPHEKLKPGDSCPECGKGTVYETAEPGRLVRIRGQAPLGATVYELQKLRCNLCGEIFTAKPPEDVGDNKYDAESAAMIALLKYGSGVPFNRMERLQENLGIPLPASTQWEILTDCLQVFVPIHQMLILTAAQGKVLHNDDTGMKILNSAFLKQAEEQTTPDRKGVFTSGIVSVDDGHRIALFFTGHKHAGENLTDVLKHRALELTVPIQMCDALSRNLPKEFQVILANCLSHGRRRFVEVSMNFPQECRYVLEILGDVYANDAEAKKQGFSDQQRLEWHQAHSGTQMAKLQNWLTEQIEQHKVEPNSSLGEAISYMLKHWQELTLFLRQPGAPLDNNVCERALKKAILHRKNSYFYKTANGARVGDLFMSLIHTCELNDANPFDYLTQLQKHAEAAALCPADWMPWNYQQTPAMSQTPGNS